MASFSKQYIENSNLDFKWDFDLEEIFNTLERGYYYPALCEGFGFTAAGKDNDGNEIVFIRDFNSEDGGLWVDYQKLIKERITNE